MLVLSLFPGIGLLDRAFEEHGFTVVRGPDLLWGGNIKRFHAPAGRFDGVIGGPPCQCFSRLVPIIRHNGYKLGENLIPEFVRIIGEAQPSWFVMENVEGAPIPSVPGYKVDPTLLNNRSLGQVQSRIHRFSFGTRDGRKLQYKFAALEAFEWDYRVCASDFRRTPGKLLTGGKQKNPKGRKGALSYRGTQRDVGAVLKLQGLPADFFDYSPFTMRGKIESLGNGVPLFMGRELARAVAEVMDFGQGQDCWAGMTDSAKWPEDVWPRCAQCGKISGCRDSKAWAAFYSTLIECPELNELLCDCHD